MNVPEGKQTLDFTGKSSLTSTAGQCYYLNALPATLTNEVRRNPSVLYERQVNLFFKRNLFQPVTVLSELRSWLNAIKQPTESAVRQAMILTIDEDYIIKSGGGSKSDHLYSSSLRWLQAHPMTGNDTEPVLIKKNSTNFADVLITAQDVTDLIEPGLTVNEKNEQLTDRVDSVLALLHRGYLTGTIDVVTGSLKKTVAFTGTNQQNLLALLDTPQKLSIARQRIAVRNADARTRINHIDQPGNGILGTIQPGADWCRVCPEATRQYRLKVMQGIAVWKQVEQTIFSRPVNQRTQTGQQIALFG